ncbi:replication protein A 70 kDa DNA-binding subunit B-like [Chenopodium quinoa]|uniref:replication protein A 70 kDa DNA-binding subunit B-like n=1 Tax=Chenopodium quinoa TaxID=63459 RepID=UPI000B773CDE|nr:replication protein A 70 kDa DNA-binding subunit B-like [Chenopodium quinoa]
MSYTMLNYITPLKENWKIKVRIVRVWYVPDYNKPEKIGSIEFVLVDEKGSKMQASIKQTLIQRFEKLVNEGSTCIISNFGVGKNYGKYRATYVIGTITGIGKMIDESKGSTPNFKLPLEIEDQQKNKLKTTLWGKYAEQVSNFVKDDIQGHVVIIIQFAMIKIFRDEVTLQNSLFATKIFLNEDMSEVRDFRGSVSIIGGDDSRSQNITQLPSQMSHSLSDEFLIMYERKQLDEICETNKKCYFVTFATIVGIESDTAWYYNSCKQCNKKVDYEGGGRYWCQKCDAHVQSALPRYKVTLTVEDDSGTTTFVMFDREIFQILQISAMDLKDKLSKEGR